MKNFKVYHSMPIGDIYIYIYIYISPVGKQWYPKGYHAMPAGIEWYHDNSAFEISHNLSEMFKIEIKFPHNLSWLHWKKYR